VSRIRALALAAMVDSHAVANLLPITTPSAPRLRAAKAALASEIPPAAKIGTVGPMAEHISGTSEMMLAEFAAP